jgi:hypothetical protein
MAAIISDKFRIFNSKQFLESLTEGNSDTGSERTRMYFFVGRPQRWDAYVEIFSKSAADFQVGEEVTVNGGSTFRAKVRAATETALLVYDVFPQVNSVPPANSTITGSTSGATAKTGVYRYATEEVPPVPLDNQKEKYDVYDDIIAAKRITSDFARAVIRHYRWDTTVNPKFDMWKPDYSATPSGGQVGKQSATGATTIADAKFYVINSQYEVFKCLYNGQNPSNLTGQNATYEPLTTATGAQGSYDAATGLFTEGINANYIWKYMYTIPTDDVLRFLSADFIPIVLPSNASRQDTEGKAVAGAIYALVIEDFGANLPANGTYYAPINGDGTGGIASITIASGAISDVAVVARGSGYTYASIAIETGEAGGGYGMYDSQALSTPVTIASNATGAVEVIIPPQGGHGSDFEMELNAKRVMTNIRLSYAEGSGDFPVDNDFRRIGILKDPYNWGTTIFATADTVANVRALKVTGATADYQVDETITQVNSGVESYGTVVSWTLDESSTTDGVLKYFQSPEYHTFKGEVVLFDETTGNPVVGSVSQASGTIDNNDNSTVLGVTFANGVALPEIAPNSGDIIYVENRRLITRAPDQIEDIKLVIEF